MLLRGPRRRSHQSRTSFQGMISEIDTSSVVDETESTKVTTESQMAECSTELMQRPETTDGFQPVCRNV